MYLNHYNDLDNFIIFKSFNVNDNRFDIGINGQKIVNVPYDNIDGYKAILGFYHINSVNINIVCGSPVKYLINNTENNMNFYFLNTSTTTSYSNISIEYFVLYIRSDYYNY